VLVQYRELFVYITHFFQAFTHESAYIDQSLILYLRCMGSCKHYWFFIFRNTLLITLCCSLLCVLYWHCCL